MNPRAGGENAVKKSALDAIDRIILTALIRNGRASYAELGALAGLSPHAVAPRVRRLVEAGVITGFTATVAYGAVGRGFEALIDIRLLPTSDPDAFEAAVSEIESIQGLVFVTGRFDYQLRVACIDADDLDHTIRLLRQAGAAVTETHVMLRRESYARAIRDYSSISDGRTHDPTVHAAIDDTFNNDGAGRLDTPPPRA
jgi:Lrp/AsnC family transcriptional regulator, leucine-responsive regulatory protein